MSRSRPYGFVRDTAGRSTAAVNRLTADGSVVTFRIISAEGFESEHVLLRIVTDGQFSRMAAYETRDLDLALARFDELTSGEV